MAGMTSRPDAVETFAEAAQWFGGLVLGLRMDQLGGPGLGDWNLRQLVAHGGRALVTTEEYLRARVSAETEVHDEDPIASAGSYFLSAHDNPSLHRAVAERGRAEAERLGDDLLAEVAGMVERVTMAVHQAPESAVFETRLGTVGFSTYLCTRTVELVVHGIDVADAAGLAADVPARSAGTTVAVLAELARQRGEAVPVIAALSGRRRLPERFGLFT